MDVINGGGEAQLSWKEKVKNLAQGKVQKEKEEKATEKLVELYRKLAQAEKVVSNIKNEIADYEMDLDKA